MKTVLSVDDGKALDITENPDILRFCALAFLPQATRHDEWFVSITIRVLHNQDLSAE